MVTATTGNAVPRVLKPVVGLGSLVDMAGLAWSPDGKWIAYQATDGLVHLIAPDGGGDHIATSTRLLVWTFAADSQSLYGIVARGANAALVAVSLPAGALRTIANLGTDFPASQLQPGYQLTLAPDGNTVTYGTGKTGNEIDLVQPFSIDGAGMARLRRWLHLP